MPEIVTTALSFVTPGAVKSVLALIALVAMTVGFVRKSKGGTVPLAVATAGWLILDMLINQYPALVPGVLLRWGLAALLIVMTLLMRRWRWAGWLNMVCFLAATVGDGLLFLPSLLKGMLHIGGARSIAEVVYALLCFLVCLVAVAYSVCLAVWKKPAASVPVPADVPASSPLPADVTLEEILPEAEPQPAVHTAVTAAPKAAAPLPDTLLQTGIGAEILRSKRQLDAGEITPEEFARRKAVLMGRRP